MAATAAEPEMTDLPDQLSPEDLERTVALYVAATSGDSSPVARRVLTEWAERSPAHRREVARLEALAEDSRRLRDAFPLPRRPRNVTRWWAAGLAAAAASLALWLMPPVVVRADGLRPLVVDLPDGSTLALDAGSVAHISRLPWPRRVTLVEGRALFTVVHDDFTPFLVQAGPASLRDMGTRFLVETSSGETRIAVFEGEVQVNGTLSLRPGQAALASATEVRPAPAPDEEQAAGWSHGRLVFKNTPLSEVAAMLSRYQSGGLRVDPAIAHLKVSGAFDLGQQTAILRGLEQVLPVRVRQEASGTAIVPRK